MREGSTALFSSTLPLKRQGAHGVWFISGNQEIRKGRQSRGIGLSIVGEALQHKTPLRPSETRFRQAIRASQANEKCHFVFRRGQEV
jgi:hypothetical protein